MAVSAYDHVQWRGVTLDRKTKRALEWAEEKCGVTLSPSQGSFSSSVAASGSTHHGGGAVDLRVAYYSDHQRKKVVKALKDAGFACWYRKPCSSWGPHIHAILINDNLASSSAQWQVDQYDAGRSGLTSGGADNTYRPHPRVRFNFKKKKPVPR